VIGVLPEHDQNDGKKREIEKKGKKKGKKDLKKKKKTFKKFNINCKSACICLGGVPLFFPLFFSVFFK